MNPENSDILSLHTLVMTPLTSQSVNHLSLSRDFNQGDSKIGDQVAKKYLSMDL